VTQAARDCRINHCDFSDMTNHVNCIQIRPRHFAEGTARNLLIDYCYFHDINTNGLGSRGTPIIQTFFALDWIDLPRGSTIIVDHCLFESLVLANVSELMVMKIGGWVVRFSTFLGSTGEYLQPRGPWNMEYRSNWIEGLTTTALLIMGKNHLIIGNRFVGAKRLGVWAGNATPDDVANGPGVGNLEDGIDSYQRAEGCLVVGNTVDRDGGIEVGAYWPTDTEIPVHEPALNNVLEANVSLQGGNAHTLFNSVHRLSPSQVNTTVSPTTAEAFTPAVKLKASDVGLNAPDPLCA
jgi:hypothetical protein